MVTRVGYFGGGQYYCHNCKKPHNDLSELGKKHIVFASEAIQVMAFKDYGVY